MKNKPSFICFLIPALILFGASIIFFIVGLDQVDFIKESLRSLYHDLPKWLIESSSLNRFIFIFLNNSSKALMVIFFGILFGIFPLIFMFINGQVIGLVSAMVYLESGYPVLLAGVLPHGITELFAIILAGGYGMWLGVKFFQYVFLVKKREFGEAVRYAFWQYIKVILPLLFLSALIEAFITPYVIQLAGGI